MARGATAKGPSFVAESMHVTSILAPHETCAIEGLGRRRVGGPRGRRHAADGPPSRGPHPAPHTAGREFLEREAGVVRMGVHRQRRAEEQGEGPAEYLVALGYAGWGEGQLEREIVENAWLSGPASQPILFDTPAEERWEEAAALLGIDVRLMSGDAGHA